VVHTVVVSLLERPMLPQFVIFVILSKKKNAVSFLSKKMAL